MAKQLRKKAEYFLITLVCLLLACLLSACNDAGHGGDEPPAATDESWTVMLYICGSDLETKNGVASKNIAEMLGVTLPQNVRVVIETGGAKEWHTDGISAFSSDRYLIKDNKLELLERNTARQNMGAPATLQSFVDFGLKNYSSKHNVLVFWNHGGGSLKGVCFDQNFNYDGLTLVEINTALSGVEMPKKFDFVGFDACLMATLDTASALVPYADYLLASEEIEPSGGWDYSALLNTVAQTATANPVDVGKAVCNAYKAKCDAKNKGGMVTLSLIDLSKIGEVTDAMNKLFSDVCEVVSQKYTTQTVVRAVNSADKFGGRTAVEGYSNYVDIKEFADSLSTTFPAAAELSSALSSAVVHSVCGALRENSNGVSLYYPYRFKQNEFNAYLEICEFEGYKRFLNAVYGSLPASTISFADSGSIAADGSFRIQISTESVKYISSVSYLLLEFAGSGENVTVKGLGEDNDIKSSGNGSTYNSNFRGVWMSLDGHKLSCTPIETSDEYLIFSAPIILNGKQTNLRFSFIFDDSYPLGGYYNIIGVFNGINASGIADKEITPLKQGDSVTTLYNVIDVGDYSSTLTGGETFVIGNDGGVIAEQPLAEHNYQYVYKITDIFGKTFYSSTALFEMQYTYEQLLEHPLNDGEYAARITVVSDEVDNELAYGK